MALQAAVATPATDCGRAGTATTADPLNSGSDPQRPDDNDLLSTVADEHRGRAHESSDTQSGPDAATSSDATLVSRGNQHHSATTATGRFNLRSKREHADVAADSPAKQTEGGHSGKASRSRPKQKKRKSQTRMRDHTVESMARLAGAKSTKRVPESIDEKTMHSQYFRTQPAGTMDHEIDAFSEL
ncbi:uncharacterized protein B0I36DRAFT_367120 [Microdochium trichocladiopsis]|uniref:Uncharacterized protein n=1 Tax=Microdochium trichocladiopsis TaxID=1682393 RepID=A0A9P9BM94_9PEZI|nr:uncharacterized protein B0I36DRAFT_367120 [Microdochium trichocladiopsis]KAH7025255.1 hypothetical protein B0I36DRAFT_367120 [Microdochium trichocladiopsis]